MQTSKTHLVDVYVRGFVELENVIVHFDGPVSIFARHQEFRHGIATEKVHTIIHKQFLGETVTGEHLVAADFADEITCVHEVAKLMLPHFKKEFEQFLRDANASGRAGHVWGKILEVAMHQLSPEPVDSCRDCRTRRMLRTAKQRGTPVQKMTITTTTSRA